MKVVHDLAVFVLLLASVSQFLVPAFAFLHQSNTNSLARTTTTMNAQPQEHHPFCDLPGDPSLIIVTNIDLGDKKLDIMKGKICPRKNIVLKNVRRKWSILVILRFVNIVMVSTTD